MKKPWAIMAVHAEKCQGFRGSGAKLVFCAESALETPRLHASSGGFYAQKPYSVATLRHHPAPGAVDGLPGSPKNVSLEFLFFAAE